MMEERFYYCNSCGNLAIMAIASGVAPYCCGDEMEQLTANTKDTGHEKHLPYVEASDLHSIKIRIGEENHPMTDKHQIKFVCLETTLGLIIRYLNAGDEPEVCIHFDGKPVAIYAYCNIHGMWKTEI